LLTTGLSQIILILLQQWLTFVPSSPRISKRRPSVLGYIDAQPSDPPIRRQSYPVINSMCCCEKCHHPSVNHLPDLLRVIRKGPAVKAAVDDAIDQCAEVFNLRDSIEEARIRAEQATDESEKRSFAQKGLLRSHSSIDFSLNSSKGFRTCGGTLSSLSSRHTCNPQSRIHYIHIRRLSPS